MSAGRHFWVVRPPEKGVASRWRAGGWIPRILKNKIGVRPQTKEQDRGLTPNSQRGFTLLGVLLVVAATGAGLAAVGELASHALQREKEAELLFVGDQYREAIASYHRAQKKYPASLEVLLEDRSGPMPRRHLRKLYPDPVSGKPFVPVEAQEGGVMGVRSASDAEPVKSANFFTRDEAFTDAKKYSEWQFVFIAGKK